MEEGCDLGQGIGVQGQGGGSGLGEGCRRWGTESGRELSPGAEGLDDPGEGVGVQEWLGCQLQVLAGRSLPECLLAASPNLLGNSDCFLHVALQSSCPSHSSQSLSSNWLSVSSQ